MIKLITGITAIVLGCYCAFQGVTLIYLRAHNQAKYDIAHEILMYTENPNEPVALGSDQKKKIRIEVVNKDRKYFKITEVKP